MKGIEVDGQVLDIPTTMAIIDSGTTLAYLPHKVYSTLMDKVTTDINFRNNVIGLFVRELYTTCMRGYIFNLSA